MKVLRINEPLVIYETFEAESFIIDYATGNYFALEAAGTLIWELFSKSPLSSDQIVQGLNLKDSPSKEKVEAFIDKLLEKSLLVQCDKAVSENSIEQWDSYSLRAEGVDWDGLSLEEFTDMKMIIKLDPVHEIDGAGWPRLSDEDE